MALLAVSIDMTATARNVLMVFIVSPSGWRLVPQLPDTGPHCAVVLQGVFITAS